MVPQIRHEGGGSSIFAGMPVPGFDLISYSMWFWVECMNKMSRTVPGIMKSCITMQPCDHGTQPNLPVTQISLFAGAPQHIWP